MQLKDTGPTFVPYMTNPIPSPIHHTVHREAWSLWNGTQKFSRPNRRNIYAAIKDPVTTMFWIRHHRIPPASAPLIDWDSSAAGMKSMNKTSCTWVTKHASEECGVGITLVKWKKQTDDKCPISIPVAAPTLMTYGKPASTRSPNTSPTASLPLPSETDFYFDFMNGVTNCLTLKTLTLNFMPPCSSKTSSDGKAFSKAYPRNNFATSSKGTTMKSNPAALDASGWQV